MIRKNYTADQNWVRRMNRSIILEVLRIHHTLSRAGLASETGLNPSTVSSIISELLNDNLVHETDLIQRATGRPGRLLELNPQGGCALGIEINVDYMSIALTDFTANILWRKRLRSDPDNPHEIILDQAKKLLQEALDIGSRYRLRYLGVGVGVPGLVDLRTGDVKIAPNLKWYNMPVREPLAACFDLPIYVENEANAAALGEYYFGVARQVENFIYLSAGIGLGSGIMIDGKLFRGSQGYASEVGHMTFDVNGELCGCGKRGCWETFVGPRAVERRVRNTLREGTQSCLAEMASGELENIDFELVVQAAQKGDPVALAALHEVGYYLGLGVANLVNVFNPEMIVLGGALNLASPILLPVMEQTMVENALFTNREKVKISASAHGTDACLMGTIALVLDDILREPLLY